MSSTNWEMPRPNVGDVVLVSSDYRDFTRPSMGWVLQEPGDTTISIVTITPAGQAMVYPSCHHKDDPALREDHGWQDLGVWDFAPMTKVLRDLTAPSEAKTGGTKSSK